jgi:hypothetical protein
VEDAGVVQCDATRGAGVFRLTVEWALQVRERKTRRWTFPLNRGIIERVYFFLIFPNLNICMNAIGFTYVKSYVPCYVKRYWCYR